MKTGKKIILGLFVAILFMGLGAWIEDFITREKDVRNSPISYEGQEFIEPYTVEESPSKTVEAPEKTKDSFSFSLSSGESKTVVSGNTTVSVSYSNNSIKSDKNLLSSINGKKLDRLGEFDITIDGIKYHIRHICLKCHECGRTTDAYRAGVKGKGICVECGNHLSYDNDLDFSVSGIMFNCPECGEGPVTCYNRDNFCEKCGHDLRPDRERLKNYKWESR